MYAYLKFIIIKIKLWIIIIIMNVQTNNNEQCSAVKFTIESRELKN